MFLRDIVCVISNLQRHNCNAFLKRMLGVQEMCDFSFYSFVTRHLQDFECKAATDFLRLAAHVMSFCELPENWLKHRCRHSLACCGGGLFQSQAKTNLSLNLAVRMTFRTFIGQVLGQHNRIDISRIDQLFPNIFLRILIVKLLLM